MPTTTTTTTMSPTTTTTPSSSPKRTLAKRTPVPILLESFPSPPSFIPPSPVAPTNPPPSLPPSLPLPPVPGPSPISQEETLLFLSTARSSRSTKLSLTSTRSSSPTNSRRNSTATIASFRSVALTSRTPASVGLSTKRESVASVHSTRSNYPFPTLPQSPHFPALPDSRPYSISEEDATDVVALSRLSGFSPLPLADVDEDDVEKVLDLAPLAPFPTPGWVPPHANESISIDTRDLPALQNDTVSKKPRTSHSKASNGKPRVAVPLPSSSPPHLEDNARSPSPDIKDILSATSRPRKSSHRSRSRSRPRKHSGVRKSPDETLPSVSRRTSDDALLKPFRGRTQVDDQDWQDDSFVSDYGVPLHRDTEEYGLDYLHPELEARLEMQLEGVESDSDSSLDLHTPLPNLMLRHGHLSPHSKLLPQNGERSSDRPGSVFSVASTTSKSGFKDDRDTPKRRNRHRDGRLLRGGIGLTTGLGWSDSEDEDAPSALTRRISSLNLSRQASMSSVRSVTRHATSLSSSAWGEDETDLDRSTSRSTRTPKGRSSLPPTSWQKRSVSSRMSSSSTSSMVSLSLSIPEQSPVLSQRLSRTESSLRVRDVPEMSRASSTASSVSIQLPVTPNDTEEIQSPKLIDTGKSLPPLPNSVKITGAPPRAFVTRSRAYSSSSTLSSAVARDPSNSSNTTPPSSNTTLTAPRQVASTRPLHLPASINSSAKDTPRSATASTFSRSPSDRQRLRAMVGPRYSDSSLQPPSLSASRSAPAATAAAVPSTVSSSTPAAGAATSATTNDPPVKPRPRIGTGMPYRIASHSSSSVGSRMRMPGTTGGSGLPRIPVASPRGVAC